MKKSLSLILIFSISLFMLIGCGKTDKPTDVVNKYFSNIKSQTDSDVVENVISSVFTNEDESTSKEAKDALNEALSKLEVVPEKETIDSYNSATVSVKVKGISLSSVTDSLIDEIQNSSELNKLENEEQSKKITDILIDKIKNAEVKERTCPLNITKENNKWKLNTDNDDFLKAIWDTSETQMKALKH